MVVRVPQFSLPGPGLLDRYIAQLYLRTFGLAFVGMMGIFYIATFIDLSEKLFKGQTTGTKLLAYLVYATPQFVYYVLAISVLVATLVTIGLLTKNSELVVMRACGISLYRAAVPLVLMGVVWSGVLFALEERVVAKANIKAEALNDEIRGRPPRTVDVLNRKWTLSAGGDIYYYVHFDTRKQELAGVSVYEMDNERWRLTRRTFATRAVYTDAGWQASQGWVREFSPKPDVTSYKAFDARALTLDKPDRFVTEQPDAERMTYQQLQHYIGELQSSGFNSVPYAVELHRKLSFPLVTIVMTLLALPFAVTTGSRGALYGIGIGLVIAISYWTLMSVFAAVGSGGMMPPLLAAWAPNILFAAMAGYMLLSVRT
jgi:LPS export ABC transporter permease LptG